MFELTRVDVLSVRLLRHLDVNPPTTLDWRRLTNRHSTFDVSYDVAFLPHIWYSRGDSNSQISPWKGEDFNHFVYASISVANLHASRSPEMSPKRVSPFGAPIFNYAIEHHLTCVTYSACFVLCDQELITLLYISGLITSTNILFWYSSWDSNSDWIAFETIASTDWARRAFLVRMRGLEPLNNKVD